MGCRSRVQRRSGETCRQPGVQHRRGALRRRRLGTAGAGREACAAGPGRLRVPPGRAVARSVGRAVHGRVSTCFLPGQYGCAVGRVPARKQPYQAMYETGFRRCRDKLFFSMLRASRGRFCRLPVVVQAVGVLRGRRCSAVRSDVARWLQRGRSPLASDTRSLRCVGVRCV